MLPFFLRVKKRATKSLKMSEKPATKDQRNFVTRKSPSLPRLYIFVIVIKLTFRPLPPAYYLRTNNLGDA